MKVLILGGASGDVGRDLVRKLLLEKKLVEEITATSRKFDVAQKFIKELGDNRVTPLKLDVTDNNLLKRTMSDHDLIINTIGPFFRYAIPIIRTAIESKTNYIDICDDIEPTIEALQYDRFARDAGVYILLGMGWFPGMSNLRVKALANQMDQTNEIVTAWVAGRKAPEERPSRGLGGFEHYFQALTGKIFTFRNGKRVKIPAFQKGVQLSFPEPLGNCVCYQMEHPEVVTLPYVIPGVLNASNLWSLYPSYRNRYIRFTGRLIDHNLLTIPFITKMSALFGQSAKKRYLPVLTGTYIACIGSKAGKKGQLCYSAVNTKVTVAEATSQPLACAIFYLALGGEIKPGVHLPETSFQIEDIINIGTRYNLPFVKDVIEELTWSEAITSIA